MKTDPNQPAFPYLAHDWHKPSGVMQPNKQHAGLSLRQHYAGLALQGLLANAGVLKAMAELQLQKGSDPLKLASVAAVEHADALISALNAPPAQEVEG